MLRKLFFLLANFITAHHTLMAVDNATWNAVTTTNLWQTATNWDTGIAPVSPGDTATFSQASNNTTILGTGSTINITSITFDTTTSYDVSTDIQLSQSGGTLPTINVLLGSHEFGGTGPFGPSLNNNTTLNISSGATLTFSPTSILTGSGTLTITGSGTLITQDSADGTFSPSAILIQNGNINNTGQFGRNTAITMSGGTFTNNGTLAANGSTLTLNGGHIINNANIGSNVASLTNLTINGGTLTNNGGNIIINPTNTMTINSPGILEGTGTIQTASPPLNFTVSNSGTVAPGSATSVSPGTMTIAPNGTYRQNAGGTLIIDVLNGASFSVLNTFDANLNGTLLVQVPPNFTIPTFPITILNASNSLMGTFSNAISEGYMPNSPFLLDPIPIYLSNSIELIFTLTPVPPTTNYIGGLRETIFSSVNHINIHIGREMEFMRERFASLRCEKYGYLASLPKESLIASNSEELAFNRYQEEEKQEELREYLDERTYPWNFYIGPLSSFGDVRPHNFEKYPTLAPFGYHSIGALAGFDYAFTQVGIGLLANYEQFKGMVDQSWGKFHIEEVHGSAYFIYVPEQLPGFALNGIFGGGYEWYKIKRNSPTLISGTGIGKPKGWEVDGLLGLEYAFTRRNIYCICDTYQFIPMAQIQYIYMNIDQYSESGLGTLGTTVDKQHPESLRTLLGARFVFQYDFCYSFLTSCRLEFDGAWQREFIDHHRNVTIIWTNFPTAAPTTLDTVRAGRNLALFGADLLLTFCERYGIEASYDFEWNKLFHDSFFYLGFNARF